MLDLYVEYRMCSYACGFLLWVECSTQVRQLIVLYGETITGHLLNKWQRKCILPIVSWFFIKTYMTCTPFFYLDFSGCCQANCEYYWIRDKNSKKRLLYVWLFLCVCVWYLWDEREKVFVVGKLQMFGEETMQPGDLCLVPLSFLVVHVLHVCRRRRRDVQGDPMLLLPITLSLPGIACRASIAMHFRLRMLLVIWTTALGRVHARASRRDFLKSFWT